MTRDAAVCLGQMTFGYETALGARISRDPLGDPTMRLMSGIAGIPRNVGTRFSLGIPVEMLQGPNLYAYVRNNPIDLVDPLGESGTPWHSAFDPFGPVKDTVIDAVMDWAIDHAVNAMLDSSWCKKHRQEADKKLRDLPDVNQIPVYA